MTQTRAGESKAPAPFLNLQLQNIMRVIIETHTGAKQFIFQSLHVSQPKPHQGGDSLEHCVKIRARDHLVLAFTNSSKSGKSLFGRIKSGTPTDLWLNERCLALGVLCHPRGWPECQQPVSYLARGDKLLLSPTPVVVPMTAAEVFPPIQHNGFALVDSVPDAPYPVIKYGDVCNLWLKGRRVGLGFDPVKNSGLCRIVVVTKSLDSACKLRGGLSRKKIQALRVNETVRAILQEVRGDDQETRLRIDGSRNLMPNQRRAIQEIGGTNTDNNCFLTKPLRWEHARMLAAVKLF